MQKSRIGRIFIDHDQTLALARRGYLWAIQLRAGRPAVRTRLLGRRALVIGGPAGVQRFYAESLRRSDALPPPITFVLFGPGTIHGLDDDEHHQRKTLFIDLLQAPVMTSLRDHAAAQWDRAIEQWPVGDVGTIFPLAVDTIARTVMPWAGLELDDHETVRRGRQLTAIVDGFMRPVVPYARALIDRVVLDRWAAKLITDVRDDRLDPPPGTALRAAAEHRDLDRRLLPPTTAGVELLNVLRPTLAASWFVTFAALALQEHPERANRVATDPQFCLAFAQETRRYYPFVPALVARTRTRQDILGHRVGPNTMVVLDVYGTNHDPDSWDDPDAFRPERFLGDVPADAFVPQGGGQVSTGHRCPGEDVVLIMITAALEALSRRRWQLVPQNLSWPTSPLPTKPRSDLVLRRLPDPS